LRIEGFFRLHFSLVIECRYRQVSPVFASFFLECFFVARYDALQSLFASLSTIQLALPMHTLLYVKTPKEYQALETRLNWM